MNSLFSTFSGLHNILRYLVLIFTIVVVAQSLIGFAQKKTFVKGNRLMALFMMISCDIQLLAGLAVYYLGGHLLMLKEGTATASHYNRFYSIEHPASMIIGIVLIHIAYSTAKKNMDDTRKFKRMFWYAFIALFLFMAQTPWPSKKDVGKPLFPGMAAVN